MNHFRRSIVAILLLLAGCAGPNSRVATKLNKDAALIGAIPSDPLHWVAITSGAKADDPTMYILFGNALAAQYSRSNPERRYPDGSVLSLVTWQQQEDSRWFGAKIPAAPKSVEFVSVRVSGEDGPVYSYQRCEGSPLKETTPVDAEVTDRIAYVLSQRAAVMP